VHSLNLALKNICATKNTKRNIDFYEEFSWISQIVDDTTFTKNLFWGTL